MKEPIYRRPNARNACHHDVQQAHPYPFNELPDPLHNLFDPILESPSPLHGRSYPFRPDGLALELIYKPQRNCQEAHAVHSREEIRCEGNKMRLSRCYSHSDMSIRDAIPGETNMQIGSSR